MNCNSPEALAEHMEQTQGDTSFPLRQQCGVMSSLGCMRSEYMDRNTHSQMKILRRCKSKIIRSKKKKNGQQHSSVTDRHRVQASSCLDPNVFVFGPSCRSVRSLFKNCLRWTLEWLFLYMRSEPHAKQHLVHIKHNIKAVLHCRRVFTLSRWPAD